MARHATVLAVLLFACTMDARAPASTTQALIAGELDPGHPAVVALVINANAYCTGTLISARVVLTAAHCVELAEPESVFFGSSLAQGGKLVPVERARVHPAFTPGQRDDAPMNDIAALLLVADAPAKVAPMPVLDPTLGSALEPDRELVVVGFGGVAPSPGGAGIKRKGTVAIDSVDDRLLFERAAPSQPCGGDSGGPALLAVDGVEYLAGITAGGDASCSRYSVHTRADAYVDDFIRHFPEPQGQIGERCFQDGNCVSGLCIAPRSSAAFAYCSTLCRDDRDCEGPALCVRDHDGSHVCRLAADEPGALGNRYRTDVDCASRRCDRFADAGTLACTLDCDHDDEIACPEGFLCQPALSTGGHVCVRAPPPTDAGAGPQTRFGGPTLAGGSGDCAVRPRRAQGLRGFALLLLLLAARLLLRRRGGGQPR